MGLADLFPYDTPAMMHPPGVQSNFDNPENRGYILIIIGAILLAFVILFAGVRFYIKVFVVKSTNWGDLLCLIATVGCVAYYSNQVYGIVRGPMGKHLWNVRISEAMDGVLLITASFVTALLLSPTLLAAKLAIFALYYELFKPFKWMRICIYIGMGITIPFYIGSMIAFVYLAVPKKGETWETHGLSHETVLTQNFYIPNRAVGLVIDVYLLILPLRAVANLHLPTKRKIEVMFVFLTGGLATLCSSLSIYYATIQISNGDVTWNSINTQITAIVEIDVGVMIACMPSMSRLLHSHMPSLKALRSPFSIRSSNFRRGNRSGDRSTDYLDSKSHSRSDDSGPRLHFNEDSLDVESGQSSSLREYRRLQDENQPVFELNTMNSVTTHIASETSMKHPKDDRIHLKREIWQN